MCTKYYNGVFFISLASVSGLVATLLVATLKANAYTYSYKCHNMLLQYMHCKCSC